MLHIGTKPVAIRLACILNGKVHLPNKMPGYVDVIPLYVNDAAKADNIMADPTGFHPGFDLGVYSGERITTIVKSGCSTVTQNGPITPYGSGSAVEKSLFRANTIPRTWYEVRDMLQRAQLTVSTQPKYIVDVFDNTKMRFDDDSNLIHPNLLKANDLVVMECHMHLDADPQSSSPPSMYLVTYEIRLVHLASEASNVRLVCVE